MEEPFKQPSLTPSSSSQQPPNAERRSTIAAQSTNGSTTDPSPPQPREDLMIDRLGETSRYIHSVATEATKEVGAKNVIVGILSQGCTATLISVLTWESELLGAGLGRLPLRQHVTDITDPQTMIDGGEDPFAREDDADRGLDLPAQAVAWLREEFDLPAVSTLSVSRPNSASSLPAPSSPMPFRPCQRTPFLLAHGTEDGKVKVELGHEARDSLASLGAEASCREYEGLGHWYSGQVLGDLLELLGGKTGWTGKSETRVR